MNDIVSTSTSRQRFNMWLMSIFGAAAMLLAAVGIYGLMAYSVAQRLQEIGIRLALGAQANQVRNMIVLQGMLLATIGIAIGLGGAVGLVRYLSRAFPDIVSTFLFRVGQYDAVTFTAVPIALVVVALVAVWVPAVRASRVDPLTALRYE